jgi:arginyl-tRNA synthetase
VLTADVRRAVWDAARDAVAAGELPTLPPAQPGQPADPSTLRSLPAPAPSHDPQTAHGPHTARGQRTGHITRTSSPGHYASTLPFLLAQATGQKPDTVAALLAPRLAAHPWVAQAEASHGYLTCAVTPEALTSQVVNPASDILRGMTSPPPALTPLAGEISRLLARTAGATFPPERFTLGPPAPAGPQRATPEDIGEAVAYAGPDPVRYALIKAPATRLRPAAVRASVRYHLDNPVYAVRYAHAHASATLRQAAELGFRRGDAAGVPPHLLAHPCERVLLDAMSWLPERVAWAGRRGRPGDMARYLEELAGAYHDCRESCPALPFGGRGAPRDESMVQARLWLVTAARATVGAGLGLLGISAPERL